MKSKINLKINYNDFLNNLLTNFNYHKNKYDIVLSEKSRKKLSHMGETIPQKQSFKEIKLNNNPIKDTVIKITENNDIYSSAINILTNGETIKEIQYDFTYKGYLKHTKILNNYCSEIGSMHLSIGRALIISIAQNNKDFQTSENNYDILTDHFSFSLFEAISKGQSINKDLAMFDIETNYYIDKSAKSPLYPHRIGWISLNSIIKIN